MSNEPCENCTFFERWREDRPEVPRAYFRAFNEDEEGVALQELGECRRYAPMPVSETVSDHDDGSSVIVVRWPVVSIHHWCGEFAAKQEE